MAEILFARQHCATMKISSSHGNLSQIKRMVSTLLKVPRNPFHCGTVIWGHRIRREPLLSKIKIKITIFSSHPASANDVINLTHCSCINRIAASITCSVWAVLVFHCVVNDFGNVPVAPLLDAYPFLIWN